MSERQRKWCEAMRLNPSTASPTFALAIRAARVFGKKRPSKEKLMEWGMSRAGAYRFLAAWDAENGDTIGKEPSHDAA